ncbi:MAG: protein kinase [Chlamydiia bacterium]|nr:protein kinase [Chlamydiia bacterium]
MTSIPPPCDLALDHMRAIAYACEHLDFDHSFSDALFRASAAIGTARLVPSIISELRAIALDAGYRQDLHFKDLKALNALLSDSPIEDALLLVRGQLEGMLIEAQRINQMLPMYIPPEAPQILLARDNVRESILNIEENKDEKDQLRQKILEIDKELAPLLRSSLRSQRKKRKQLQKKKSELTEKLERLYARDRRQLQETTWCLDLTDNITFETGKSHALEPILTRDGLSGGAFKSRGLRLNLNSDESSCVLSVDFSSMEEKERYGSHLLHLHELSAWKSLMRHHIPNIPELRHIENTGSSIVLDVENYGAGDLADFAAAVYNSCLPDAILFQVARTVMETLSCMHDNGFLHRDVKPENILIRLRPCLNDEEPEIESIALTDFGFTTSLAPYKQETQCKCGTPDYAAPEIWERASAGAPADVWSAAATFFALRYGKHLQGAGTESYYLPHGNESLKMIYAARCDKRLSELDAFDHLLIKMFSYSPADRPTARFVYEWLKVQN